MTRELQCYDYVPVPYAKVREALRADAAGIFQRATAAAAARAGEVVATLRAQVGGLDIGVDVNITAGAPEDSVAHGQPSMRLDLAWTAAKNAGLFPAMEATFTIYPLSSTETQLDLHGRYTPPLGFLGSAGDALVGHRVAQAAVLRFVQDVSARLRAELR